MNSRKSFSCRTFLPLAAGALLTFALTPVTQAQVNIGISIGTPPPPVRYEVRPVFPGEGYAWREGYWAPYGGRYRWHRGLWVRQPFADAYYVRPAYDSDDRGYRYRPGHWEHRGDGAYGREKEFHDNGHHGDKEHHDNGHHGEKDHRDKGDRGGHGHE